MSGRFSRSDVPFFRAPPPKATAAIHLRSVHRSPFFTRTLLRPSERPTASKPAREVDTARRVIALQFGERAGVYIE